MHRTLIQSVLFLNHCHRSGSSNFIYHYSFYHKISWTRWRRKPKILQWESLPRVREQLKYNQKKEETCKICPPLSQCGTVFRHRVSSDGAMGLFCTPTSVYPRLQRCSLCYLSPGMLHRHISLQGREDTVVRTCWSSLLALCTAWNSAI